MKTIEDLYAKYLKLTGDPTAASNLVLAECLNQAKNDDAVLTVAEAASALRVAEATIYSLCNEDKLRHTRIGAGRGTIRIRRADLDAYQGTRTRRLRPSEQAIQDRLTALWNHRSAPPKKSKTSR